MGDEVFFSLPLFLYYDYVSEPGHVSESGDLLIDESVVLFPLSRITYE
jgi:hypothetical protein